MINTLLWYGLGVYYTIGFSVGIYVYYSIEEPKTKNPTYIELTEINKA